MVALMCMLFMVKTKLNLILLPISIAMIAVIVKVSIRKDRIHAGATAISILLLILFPISFFTAGGFYSGVPEWFVICFIYICITLEGRRMYTFFLLCVMETFLCYYIAFYVPESVVRNTSRSSFFDSALSVILVGMLISVLLMFLNKIYEQENELSRQQKKEIEELNRAENHFFSSMSHEIRTPINTIIGLNEFILRGDIPPEVAENARNIQGASKLLLTLINDILDLSKIKSGKMEIVKVSYETGKLFSEIVNMIWIKAKEKGLEFRLHIDSSIPSMLCGDEVRIKQILINLLNNAVKYTKEGSVTLAVRCERLTLNRVRVWYSVEDTGQGVKKENIPYIFNAFKRVDEEKNRHIEGTGLGLSIVHQLVELMGGEISVNSVYTKGSTFLVMLEQDIVDDQELGTFTLASRAKIHDGEHYRQSFEAPEAHILVVDDNDMNLKVVRKLLTETKVQIDTASSGAECLKLTQNLHYDAILMDHLMPEMDGIEMCSKIKTDFDLCHTPVVLLTALTSNDKKLEGLQCGADEYIGKPFNNKMLQARIANILRNRKLLKQKFSQKMTTSESPAEIEIQALALNPIDAKFLEQLEETVKAHLSDSEFDVGALAKEMALSRSAFYNKLKALSCMSPNEFIMNARLKYAAELLRNHPELQITEIAYQAGFSSLRYFRHCFKACFNQSPQEYRGK